MATSAFAANKTTVNLGDQETYTIVVSSTLGNWAGTEGTAYSFAWTIDDEAAILGGQTTLDAVKGKSALVTWIKSGTFKFTIIGTDANGCKTEPLEVSVTVNAMLACVDSDNAVNKQMCSLLNNYGTGNANSQEIISFPVTVSNSSSGKTYKITYTLTNGSTTYNGQSTAYVPNSQIQVDINSTDELKSLFSAISDDNGTHKKVTVTITGVTQEGTNLSITLCGTPSYAIDVFEKPVVTFTAGS